MSQTVTSTTQSKPRHEPVVPKRPAQVARRNARERNRVRQVNMGFVTLRNHVPLGMKNKKLSKVETLRQAASYIKHLKELLVTPDPNSAFPSPVNYPAGHPAAQFHSVPTYQQENFNPTQEHYGNYAMPQIDYGAFAQPHTYASVEFSQNSSRIYSESSSSSSSFVSEASFELGQYLPKQEMPFLINSED